LSASEGDARGLEQLRGSPFLRELIQAPYVCVHVKYFLREPREQILSSGRATEMESNNLDDILKLEYDEVNAQRSS
jgi:hypothetical protein